MKKYKLIVNKAARRGKTKWIILKTIRMFRKMGVVFDLEYTRGPKDAGRIAQQACDDFDVIVAVGGDGTVNEVVQGMVFSNTPLGIIPAGTGNDFIKSLNIPKNVHEAGATILREQRKQIDIGQFNGTYFANGLGIGLDAAVNIETYNIKHCKRGLPLYFWAFLRTVRKYKPVPLKISMNGTTVEQDTLLLSVGNGTTVGGGFKLTPHAKIDDHQLDVTIVHPLPLWPLFRHLPKVFNGTIDRTCHTSTGRTQHLLIESAQTLPVHIDGEVYFMDDKTYTITIHSKALTVIGNF